MGVDSNIVDEVYKVIFCNIKNGNLDLFLCGAASTKEKISYRDSLRKKVENNHKLSILYPEDMFMELLNRKKYDLLTLEKFLAQNSDLIVIVCESPGSFTELGAFVNNNDTLEKVVVLLQTKYKNAKSFIRQGPVEYVRTKDKNNVIYFNNNVDEAAEKVQKYIKTRFGYLYRKGGKGTFKDLNLISGQYHFIILLLYFYEKISVRELVREIRRLCLAKCKKDEFEIIYSSAVKRLFKEGMIKKEEAKDEYVYTLTDKGYYFANMLLKYVPFRGRNRIINKIRMQIIYSQYY